MFRIQYYADGPYHVQVSQHHRRTGQRFILDGLTELGMLTDNFHHHFRINRYTAAREVVFGLHFLYHFHPRVFIKLNFWHQGDNTYTHHGVRLNANRWETVLHLLHRQLKICEQHPVKWTLAHYRGYIAIDGQSSKLLPLANIKATPQRIGYRKRLGDLADGHYYWFTGKFISYGRVHQNQPTILLHHVKERTNNVARHLWINTPQPFLKLGPLHYGNLLCFRARVRAYHKGWHRARRDYELYDFKQVKKLRF